MTPKTEGELSEVIRAAISPLQIIGGGTRPVCTSTARDTLTTSGLTGIILYDPGALTLVAKAGTPVAEIEAALAAENQRLAFEPMDHRALLGTSGTPTIGGVVAANISGPRRISVGACRDFLLGVRFVDGTGEAIKNGGRVMKNVTGYDLVKLMCGAHGTLGVLTEVSLKVMPDVATSATLCVPGLEPPAAVDAMSAALGSPFDVSGAAHEQGDLLIRLEGFSDSVAYRTERMKQVLTPWGAADVLDHKASKARWASVRDVTALAQVPGDIWRISVKPTDAPKLIATLAPQAVVQDWGGGLIWAAVAPGTDVRATLTARGHATLIKAAEDHGLPRMHPETGPLATISAGLRAKFDPRGILNPGVMT